MDVVQMGRFAGEGVESRPTRGELGHGEELVIPAFVDHEARWGKDPGTEGFRLRMRRLHGAIAELHMDVREVVAGGDLIAPATLPGVHTEPPLGIPATGRPSGARHRHLLGIPDGCPGERRPVRDDRGMLQRPGVIRTLGG